MARSAHRTYSRRHFGQIALAGLPASIVLGSRGASALAAAESRVNGVRIGVQSYSFRTLWLDEAIAAMKNVGLGEVRALLGPRRAASTTAAEPPLARRPPRGRVPIRRRVRLAHVAADDAARSLHRHQEQVRGGRASRSRPTT